MTAPPLFLTGATALGRQETTFGEVPLQLIFDDLPNTAMTVLQTQGNGGSDHAHGNEFDSWVYRSEAEWSFNALQRAVEDLSRDIYRAKGIVRLDLETSDYGILQVTGKRGSLRLVEPATPEAAPDDTEIVFIGRAGTNTNEGIRELFERSLEDARSQGHEAYRVKDLRAFNIVFA